MFVPHSTILVEGLVAAGIIGERAVALGSSLGRFTARIFPESATAASNANGLERRAGRQVAAKGVRELHLRVPARSRRRGNI